MKNYNIDIYRKHLSEIRDCKDPFKLESYLKGIIDLASSMRVWDSGTLDLNDIIQECYLIAAKLWNKMDFEKIKAEADDPQAYIWSYLKRTVKIQARDSILAKRDGQRIPHNEQWRLIQTKNVDRFLEAIMPTEWFVENELSLNLIEYDGLRLGRYDIEQLGIALNDVMNECLSYKEKQILEYGFGVDQDKLSSKKIAKKLNISVSNVDKTKFVAIQKLKNKEVKEYLQEFYDFE